MRAREALKVLYITCKKLRISQKLWTFYFGRFIFGHFFLNSDKFRTKHRYNIAKADVCLPTCTNYTAKMYQKGSFPAPLRLYRYNDEKSFGAQSGLIIYCDNRFFHHWDDRVVHRWDNKLFAADKFVALYSDYGKTGLERPKRLTDYV